MNTSNLLRAVLWSVEALEAGTEGQRGAWAARLHRTIPPVLGATVALYAAALYTHSQVLAVMFVVLLVVFVAAHTVARGLGWPPRAVTLRRTYRRGLGIADDN